jgi:hypothetical protein
LKKSMGTSRDLADPLADEKAQAQLQSQADSRQRRGSFASGQVQRQSSAVWNMISSMPSWISMPDTSLMSSSQSAIARVSAVVAPPIFSPVSPALNPAFQLRLGIPILSLNNFTRKDGEIAMLDRNGDIKLRAVVHRSGHSCSVELFEKDSAQAHTLIAPSSLGALAIFNAHGALYGFLETDSNGSWSVEKDADKVLLVEGSPTHMQFSVTSPSGQNIVSVGMSSDFAANGKEYVEFCFQPGVDAVLVATVVLAVILLPSPSSPGSPPHRTPSRMTDMVGSLRR